MIGMKGRMENDLTNGEVRNKSRLQYNEWSRLGMRGLGFQITEESQGLKSGDKPKGPV